jgi:phenylacetate-CoA ligase
MDHLICRVEARADCPSERRAVAASEVTKGVKDMVGCSIDVLVVDPETLPRSLAGKLQRLVDHRNLA